MRDIPTPVPAKGFDEGNEILQIFHPWMLKFFGLFPGQVWIPELFVQRTFRFLTYLCREGVEVTTRTCSVFRGDTCRESLVEHEELVDDFVVCCFAAVFRGSWRMGSGAKDLVCLG